MRTRESLLLVVLPALLAGPGGAIQDEERIAEVRKLGSSVLAQHLDKEEFQKANPATRGLILRALQLAGWQAGDPAVSPHRRALLTMDASTHPETLVHRLLLQLEGDVRVTNEWVVRDVQALAKAQSADGGWELDPDSPDDREERITVTAMVLEALSRFQTRGGTVPDGVFQRAGEFVRSQVRRKGTFGDSPRRGRPHGQATAAGALALWILAARERDRVRQAELETMIDDAEAWLDGSFRPDRNPQSLTGKYPYLWWMSVYAGRSWLTEFDGKPLRERTLRELCDAALSTAGWNERVMAGSGGAAPPAGAPRYGIPLNFDAGVRADLRDTAWGVILMFRPEWSHPLEQALATRRLLARLEKAGSRRTPLEEHLVACCKAADDRVVPFLLDGLESERSAPRRAAVSALRERAHKTFAYDPNHNPNRNRDAIRAWEAWAEDLLDGLPTEPPVPERRNVRE